VDSAQQITAEVGVQASTFASAAELTSWVGTCPGKDESAEENHSSRSAKGNKYLRRVLNQAAHAAVKKKGSYFQVVFRRLLPRLGYQSAIWAVAHRLCRVVWKILHQGVRFIEYGIQPDPQAKKRHARRLAQALRKLGYDVAITPINLATSENGVQMQRTIFAVAGHNSRPSSGSLVLAAACGSRRPTLPNCLVGIVPHFGHHRLQMTFEEGAAVPPNTAAIRVRIQDLKAKHLQIF
jgi:hypothetical protein